MAKLKQPKVHLVTSLDDEKTACGMAVSVNWKTTFEYSVTCKRCKRHLERLARFKMMFRFHNSGLVVRCGAGIVTPGI